MNPFIIIAPNTKGPRDKEWHKHGLSAAEVERRRENNPAINVGLLLGPDTGYIDVECDGPSAEAQLRELFSGEPPETVAWQSTRGVHRLFKYDARLAPLAAVVKIGEVEFRIGNGKACQSLIPPSEVDGVRREWIVPLDREPAALPDALIDKLLAQGTRATAEYTADNDPMFAGVRAAIHSAKVDKLIAWLTRANHAPKNVRTDHLGRTFLDLPHCLRGPEHRRGAPAIIVNADGSCGFRCFHPDCAATTFADLEAAFGPLNPVIKVAADIERVASEAVQALGSAPNVYQRGGLLVRIANDAEPPPLCIKPTDSPRLQPIPLPSLSEILSAAARWEKFDARKKQHVHCAPPENIVRMVDARVNWPGVPVITGIVSAPVLRADGTIASAPGYDPASGLYLDIAASYPPIMPAREAVELLVSAVQDFPFASESHRAAWITLVLTLFGRHAFGGPAPLALIDANTRGSGKTLLSDLLAIIFEGRPAARCSVPNTDDEWRKLITSLAIAAPPYVLLDNAKGKFGSPSLEKALTSEKWSDRILGSTKTISVPLDTVWIATSNNAILSADMTRRTLHIRLNSPLERPEERSNFAHEDLLAWARSERQKLAIAALSILYGYHAAGRPNQNLTPWGSFEAWSNLVRSAVVWVGLPDPGENRRALAEQADDESELLGQLMDGWAELGGPASVAEAIEKLDTSLDFPLLRAAVAELPGERKNSLGQFLKRFRGRVVGGRYFDRTDRKIPKWELRQC